MPSNPNPLNPWEVLVEAQRRVPALRFAIGVAGIAAAAAIVSHFAGDTRSAVILISLVFVGMILLFAFSRLVTARSRGARIAGELLLWSVTAFFVLFLGFTAWAAFDGRPCNWAEFLNWRRHPSCIQTNGEKPPSDPDTHTSAALQTYDGFTIMIPQDQKPPSPRYWSSKGGYWEEAYPDGVRSFHDITGRIVLNGCNGTRTRKQDYPIFEVFIPDRDCQAKRLMFRLNRDSWNWWLPMIDPK
ncbi:MAG: hypothetical protein HXX10_08165 [Rhodoplanes sp.]|uniref:hypothetical protein n=1 Tax=Rhodoplanes sp. TaxID=1968906 RepID=UPI001825E7D5|nr:hypothetical protein [Rhodoplanes sp.]NVO13997.1 hypothetical protein [Rhodoplanes sp.]